MLLSNRLLTKMILLSCMISLTASCSLFNTQASSTCKELKKQMLMTGATSNRTEALQQRAESGGLERAYRNEGC